MRRTVLSVASSVLLLLAGSDARADVNLIVNGDFSLGNTGFMSQYVYSTDLFPEDTYVVGDNPSNYNPLGASFGDHTTGTGLMLIANGSPSSNTFVWQETINVAGGTDYHFTAWTAPWGDLYGSSNDPSPADLQFAINGVQIGSDLMLSDHDGQWSQFSASWNSGTSTVATITITDLNTVSVGNDFTLDDLSFSGATVVPEPSTFTLVPLGAACLMLYTQRCRRHRIEKVGQG